MSQLELIKVNITMLSYEDGGRIQLLTKDSFGGTYRPHLVIGDLNQRKSITVEKDGFKNYLTEVYQGIRFWKGPDFEIIPVNKEFEAVINLFYYPDHLYVDVIPGATFTIREGSKIVGFGTVLKRWNEKND